MTTPALSQDLIEFAKALASESRMNILLLFMEGQAEMTVNQIAEAVNLGQPTVSEHLAIMKRSGLLTSTKRGKEVYYRPDRAKIAHSLELLTGILRNCCRM
jgi:ArsR family transcriptional regulator, arsenate/arsenite/antimonite-responsive transcriptional repressor